MKYYKNSKNEVFSFEDDIREIVLNRAITKYGLSSIDKSEANELTALEAISKRRVTYLTKSAFNNFLMVKDGEVFVTSNTQVGDFSALGTPASNGRFAFGFNNLRKLYIPSNSKVKDAFCAGRSAYVLLENGELYVWGCNGTGILGLGHDSNVYKPTLSATGVIEIFYSNSICNTAYVDSYRMFIKKTDGYIYSTGYNAYGACGNGTTTNINKWYKIENLGTDVVKIYNNGDIYGNAIAIKDDNSIWAAGYNGYGCLGTGATTNLTTFTDVTDNWGGKNIETIDIQGYWGYSTYGHSSNTNTLILRKDSVNTYLYACGNAYDHGLGLSSATTTPMIVPNTLDVKDFISIALDTWVLKNDGSLWGCGNNAYSCLGLNNTSVQVGLKNLNINGVKRLIRTGATPNYSFYSNRIILEKDDGYYVAGIGGYGCLGTGYTSQANTWTKMDFEPDVKLVDVGGYSHGNYTKSYIALDDKDRLWVWGYNGYKGVIDSGNTGDILTPILLGGGGGVREWY
ncbi:RCC1 domain-containing protein [Campylobacter hyointestinalis]|uniref:RCC1 domain-containing protein n=1 Tax=Campylobacter hyointestinalis TaxID=198 RepID=UPI0011AD8F7F|nr:hypothetical protein [Campylobacter hyointestinalis]TWO19261.1 hypothetical protein YZ80_07735 [Campylobacter hyointestinalis]